jgi:hypothetical protein
MSTYAWTKREIEVPMNLRGTRQITESAVRQLTARVLPDGRMMPGEVAKYTGYSEGTLAQWRYLGKGPPYRKIGRKVFYHIDDVDAFVASGNAEVTD